MVGDGLGYRTAARLGFFVGVGDGEAADRLRRAGAASSCRTSSLDDVMNGLSSVVPRA
jgi:hypothetical protein